MAAASRVVGEPAESTRLRIGDEITWSEINGVYDRDDSLKENTNPKCLLKNHHHPGANGGGNNTGSSQRFSGNLKPTAAPIIGLSGKLGQGCGRGRHHPPAMFPKKAKTGGGGRASRAAVPEPGSPKVSCIGKVLSDRERAARLGRPPPRPCGGSAGCCGGFAFLMRRSSRSRNSVECVDQSPPPLPPVVESAATRRRETKPKEVEAAAAEVAEAAAPAPGLGGMRRFASGRRAAEWAAEMDGDGRVATSGPL